MLETASRVVKFIFTSTTSEFLSALAISLLSVVNFFILLNVVKREISTSTKEKKKKTKVVTFHQATGKYTDYASICYA